MSVTFPMFGNSVAGSKHRGQGRVLPMERMVDNMTLDIISMALDDQDWSERTFRDNLLST